MTDADLLLKKLPLSRRAWSNCERSPSPPLAEALRAAIGVRNVLVHGYTAVNLDIVRDVLMHHLDDLARFVSLIRAKVRA
jgi:hypothetical protein